MRIDVTTALLAAALALAGCSGPGEPQEKEEPMKVEDTAFGPLVGTPKKVEERTEAAADLYRENMDKRLEEDEGGSRDETSGD